MRTIDVAPPAPNHETWNALDEVARRRLRSTGRTAALTLGERKIVHVATSSPAAVTDGVLGIALLLDTLLPLAADLGVAVSRLQIDSSPQHADLSRRLHHAWHGASAVRAAGVAPPGRSDRAAYEDFLAAEGRELAELISPGDVVVLHDPGTVGLAPHAKALGALVVWRCHLGVDHVDDVTEAAWAFVQTDVEECDAIVVSREQYVPGWLEATVITPPVDPASPANTPADTRTVLDALRTAGVIAGGATTQDDAVASFTRGGAEVLFRRDSVTLVAGDPVPVGARTVLQIGRWDPLKDPLGVLQAWEEGLERLPDDAHLVLAGPVVTEGSAAAATLEAVRQVWQGFDEEAKARTHVVALPVDDPTENRALVGMLQRHASVVVQKSLAEGWGLTVTEAMVKGRPVVASAVGGIADQITDGEDGLLLDDPHDLDGFVELVARLLDDEDLARALGRAAELRARRLHLPDRSLLDWWALIERLVSRDSAA